MSQSYDAILLVSFGGPEGPDDVIPFLENVLRGRNVPHERMVEVAEHYQRFGGVSPINGQNRLLINALEKELQEHNLDLPIYWGNRNWHPMLVDTLQQMKDAGIQQALAFVTSAFSCYSGCRQYREDIEKAQAAVGSGAPNIDKIRVFFNHPGFIQAMVEHVRDALEEFPPEQRNSIRFAFTAHSIPLTMADNCNYVEQLNEACDLVAREFPQNAWDLVYQSRSGPAAQPWLEPDICDFIKSKRETGLDHLIIVPLGFISDHIEVLFDLDTEAHELCNELGIHMVRAKTAGINQQFVSGIRELIEERQAIRPIRQALGRLGPSHDICPDDCCLSGRPARSANHDRS